MSEKCNLATYLRKYRERADYTQDELARKLGVSRQTVISLESGKCVPSVSLAMKIARFFELPVEFIFRYQEEGLKTLVDEIVEAELSDEIKSEERGGEEKMVRDLLPWSPWREMMSLREGIDRLFEEPTHKAVFSEGLFHPKVSIRETKIDFIIEADIPGVKEEELSVEVEDDKVILKGERKHREESRREDYYHMESSYGAFSRIVALPSNVDADKAAAEVKDGVLEIKVPKVEKKKTKKITVKPRSKSQKTP